MKDLHDWRASDSKTLRENPRLVGVLAIGIAFGLLGINWASLVWRGTYYPIIFLAAFPAGLVGGWVVLTGMNAGTSDVRLPWWWYVGAVGLALVGLALGVAVMVFLV